MIGVTIPKRLNKIISVLIVASIIFSMTFSFEIQPVRAAESYLLSLNRPCYASTVNGGDVPTRATDGDINTAWGAAWNVDNQWIDVDLGAVAAVDRVVLKWQSQNVYATQYQIQVSNDERTWQTVYTQNNGTGGTRVPDVNGNLYCVETLTLSGNGRYVRVYAPKCVSGFGIALRELEVYGTGGINPAPKATVNLAQNKPVTVSSFLQPWWSKDANGNVTVPLTGAQAVDGNQSTYWLSDITSDPNTQWLYVDLGQTYTIGEVDITWDAEFGRVYDIQVSNDAQNWTTVYRQMHGTGEPEKIPLYTTGRYVKMKGIAMGRGSGYSIHEFQVLQYIAGDPQPTYNIAALTQPQSVQVGKGSYLKDDMTLAHPRDPKYITSNVRTPIPSNDWWTSVIYTRLSDGMAALPLMYHYYDTGLGFYYASNTFTAPNNGGMDTKFNNMDLYINTSSIVKTPEARLDGYGDYSANIIFSDDATPKMKSTLIKGSPYVYNTFSDPNSVEISSPAIVGLFDDNNNAILTTDGASVTADHIGIEVVNTNTAPVSQTVNHSYGIFAPSGTVFTRVGSKIKIRLGGGQNYMSVGLLSARSDLNYVYQHAYAFVTNTTVTYNYDAASSNVNTTYTNTIDLKRSGFSSTGLMSLFSTQWKYTNAPLTNKSYSSARGTMKVSEGNSFTTTVKFLGITPSFGEPTESGSYSRTQMLNYLETFKESVTKDYWVADPYWQGKKLHPLSMGILIAQQLGEYETRDEFISILRKILVNWFTYTESNDYPYYMYYSPDWGTLVGQGGDHGMGINLSDHHFLWGYFTFAAGVLAAYDSDFVANYGGMVEHLLRDAQNPSKADTMYPWMRNFDPYEGHSWAGGYGDNQSGNNQESSSEATFAWAGQYLWGLATGNNAQRDAGIWGFTSEVNAIEQYWFNYDDDNWSNDYTSGCVGMVWGNAYTNGTYFSGNPSCIYGIHMLPVSPALTYLGYKPEKAASVYSAYRTDEDAYQAKLAAEGKPNEDPEGWFHILWPYESLSNPQSVINKWDDSKLPDDERFNSYWFVQNMNAKGNRATDVWSSNWTSYQVFKKGAQYSAVIWNPTNSTQFVQFRNASGNTGSAYVLPKTTLTVNPFANNPVPTQGAVPAPAADPGPIALPGKVEAESYYTNFGCHTDLASEGGTCLAFIDSNDMALYDVNVATEGDYTVSYRVLNGSGNTAQIQLQSSLSGGTVLSTTNIPSNSAWTTVSSTVHLKAGVQRLTVYFAVGGFNFNWMRFVNGDTPAPVNIALNKTASASTGIAGLAFDGNANTRWESEASDLQWISVDLGTSCTLTGAKLTWEVAAGKDYKIQVSTDGTAWNDAYTKTGGTGGEEEITFASPVTGRYVRLYGTARATAYGYSLWEFEVYGNASGTEKVAAPVITPATGTYAGAQSVTITDSTAGASIRYTTDGSVPTASTGTVYSGTFTVSSTTTVKAIAYKSGMTNSDMATSTITINNSTPGTNIALNKTAAASSGAAGLAFDGDANTRWESNASDPQWISVDLGASCTITGVKLNWETAAGKDYKIQVSTDGTTWNDAYTKTNGTGGIENITFAAQQTGRYVRMYGTARATGYGYSLWEFEVYGTSGSANIALNKTTGAASSTVGGNTPNNAFDGDTNTRWESNGSDPQWISVDLGASCTIAGVKLNWETAAGKDYKIQVSTNGTAWNDAYTKTNGTGGIENITFAAQQTGRYVRLYGTARTTGYGYSLWEFEIYGTASVNKAATPVITPASGTYTSAQTVSITDATAGATIRYTTDGSSPTPSNGTVYSGAFTVSATTTVKAIAYKTGMTDSDIVASTITINSTSINRALNKNAAASSYMGGNTAAAAFDGNAAETRWESAQGIDPQWISVDLGSSFNVTGVKLNWETAAGKDYKIQVSSDNANWTDAYVKTGGTGGIESITFTAPVTGRYVRLYGTARTTGYGYSLWEFEVYGI